MQPLGLLWRLALLYVGVAAVIPTSVDSLGSHPRPTRDYAAALRLAHAMQRADSSVAPNGGSIVLVHGARTPRAIVLFHGFSNSPRQFRQLAAMLYDHGDNVIVPRLPQHGLEGAKAADLSHLTAESLRDAADEAVDVATGLGDTVIVMGLSLGGNVAAWAAQFRPEVDRAVIVAPALALSHVPDMAATPLMNLVLRLPTVSRGEPLDTVRPDRTLGWSTHGVAQMMRLGAAVRRAAEDHPPAARRIFVLANAYDATVSHSAISDLIERWSDTGGKVSTFEFADSLHLPHDVIDPDEFKAKTNVVYPVIIALIYGTAPDVAMPLVVGDRNTAQAWITTGDRSRLLSLEPDLPIIATRDTSHNVIDVDEGTRYQEMVGFGAAMSDASAFLINRKLGAQRDALMRELFGRNPGVGFSLIRVPMGASDFSSAHYSYDDMPAGERDSSLAHFTIDADRADKLPLLKRAVAINPRLKVIGSPWSAPGWMKSTGSLIQGTLRPDAYDSFAQYLLKFIRAYTAEGVPIFAVTMQNEPAFEPADYPGMRLDAPARAALIGKHVGPLFASARISTQILDWDHNWDAPIQPLTVLADSAARRYVSGVAWHCYAGDVSAQDTVHAAHPEKDVYFTECSGGTWAPVFADNLKWTVSTLIINSVRSWARGVALWNLALDENSGPHLGGCGNCRGVLTINSVTGAVTRNEEYYALAHASMFVRPGARRIASSTNVGGLQSVAFRNADDGSKVLIVVNTTSAQVAFAIHAGGKAIRYSIPPSSVVTVRWM